MDKVFFCGLYFTVEFFKIWLVTQFFSKIQLNNKVFQWFGIALIGVMAVAPWYDIVKGNPIVYMLLIYAVYFAGLTKKKHIGWIIFFNICISIADVLISCLVIYLLPVSVDSMINSPSITIMYNTISLVILLLVSSYIRERMNNREIFAHGSDSWIYIVCAIAILILVAPMQMQMLGYEDHYSFLSATLCITLLIVSIVLLNLKKQRELIEFEKDMYHEIINTQEMYYKTLLQKEENTRCFRHDVNEYLMCIQILHQERKYEELDKYINQMRGKVKEFSPKYSTGNDYVNMILNDMINQFPDVEFELVGKIPPLTLGEMDICSLFYNLLKNAFEAAQEVDNRMVKMEVQIQETNLYITITNPFKQIKIIDNNNLQTTKSGEGHGYGIRNIKSCIEKYDGEYNMAVNDGFFKTEIIIPDSIKTE